jgi:hypothetical protein
VHPTSASNAGRTKPVLARDLLRYELKSQRSNEVKANRQFTSAQHVLEMDALLVIQFTRGHITGTGTPSSGKETHR